MSKMAITVTNVQELAPGEIAGACYHAGIPEAAEIKKTLEKAKAKGKKSCTVYADPADLTEAISDFYYDFINCFREDPDMSDKVNSWIHIVNSTAKWTVKERGETMDVNYYMLKTYHPGLI